MLTPRPSRARAKWTAKPLRESHVSTVAPGYNLRDRDPALAAADERLVQHLRNLLGVLRLNTVAASVGAGT